MFVAQFNDFMIWVLFGAVAISAIEGQIPEAVAITAILILNGVLGFVQEYRAEQALEALKQMSAPIATVLRDGAERDVPAATLVPGDIVMLEAGDRIPSDGRLLEVGALRVEEAALTGESAPVRKNVSEEAAADSSRSATGSTWSSPAPRSPWATAVYVVTATGQATEMGKIADLLAAQEDERTPLQDELQTVGKRIALIVLAIAAIVFAEEVWRAAAAGSVGRRRAHREPRVPRNPHRRLTRCHLARCGSHPRGPSGHRHCCPVARRASHGHATTPSCASCTRSRRSARRRSSARTRPARSRATR